MTAMTLGVGVMEPDDIEGLLPWHATGTLNSRDARRVDEALKRDPGLAKQYAVIQDEIAETIHVNESLGAPSSRAMQKLFAAIDAEPVRPMRRPTNVIARIADIIVSLSPARRLFGGRGAMRFAGVDRCNPIKHYQWL